MVNVTVQITPVTEVSREDKIGRGGFGNVYKGKWKFNPIAIKETKGFCLTSKQTIHEFFQIFFSINW